MAKISIQTKRAAICANRGGHEKATDEEINLIWDFLPEPVRKQYLESIKGKGKNDDSSV